MGNDFLRSVSCLVELRYVFRYDACPSRWVLFNLRICCRRCLEGGCDLVVKDVLLEENSSMPNARLIEVIASVSRTVEAEFLPAGSLAYSTVHLAEGVSEGYVEEEAANYLIVENAERLEGAMVSLMSLLWLHISVSLYAEGVESSSTGSSCCDSSKSLRSEDARLSLDDGNAGFLI